MIVTQKRVPMESSESLPKIREQGPDGRYLEPSSFIDAVAPTEEGFNRISRQQYSICMYSSSSRADSSVSSRG